MACGIISTASNEITVDSQAAIHLEALLYQDDVWLNIITDHWSKYRIRAVTVHYKPKYRYNYSVLSTEYTGTNLAHAVSQGADFRSVYSTGLNIPWSTIVERPGAKEFHSLSPNTVKVVNSDTKWYDVEQDDTTTAHGTVYNIWYLYARYFSELPNNGAPVGVIDVTFDLEVRGSKI
jgi:hypothetical protein